MDSRPDEDIELRERTSEFDNLVRSSMRRQAVGFIAVPVAALTISLFVSRFRGQDSVNSNLSSAILWAIAGLVAMFLALWVSLWNHERANASVQRKVDELSTVEVIDLISHLPLPRGQQLAARVLWMRAAAGQDDMARAYLAGTDWQHLPSGPGTSFDELKQHLSDARRARAAVVLITTFGCCLSTVLIKAFEAAATRGESAPSPNIPIALGATLVAGLAIYLSFDIYRAHGEEKKSTEDLTQLWLSGSELAERVLKRRARWRPELAEVARRSGWKVNHS